MFDVKEGFMFSNSVDGNSKLEEYDWRISRMDSDAKKVSNRAKTVKEEFNENEEATIKKLLNDLNSRVCFGFEFQPETDDRLEVKSYISKRFANKFRWYPFRYANGQWALDTSSEFEGWRSQLKKLIKGTIV